MEHGMTNGKLAEELRLLDMEFKKYPSAYVHSFPEARKFIIEAADELDRPSTLTIDDAMVERARLVFTQLLRDRNTFDTPIGEALVGDFRDAMKCALIAAFTKDTP